MLSRIKIYKALPLLIIPLLFSACENSTENNPPPDTITTFPNKAGDQWIYAVYDSLSGSVDTMTVKIVKTITANGKELSVWARNSNSYNDTLYVNIEGNTVYFYTDPYPNNVDKKIEFPLEVGNYWKNPDQISDSSIVKAVESVTVPADIFPEAYRIERTWGGFNVYGYSETWLSDNVGIVKMYQRILGFDNIKQTWELLSYSVQ